MVFVGGGKGVGRGVNLSTVMGIRTLQIPCSWMVFLYLPVIVFQLFSDISRREMRTGTPGMVPNAPLTYPSACTFYAASTCPPLVRLSK